LRKIVKVWNDLTFSFSYPFSPFGPLQTLARTSRRNRSKSMILTEKAERPLNEQTLIVERDTLKKTLLEDMKKKDSVEHKMTAEFQELKKVEASLERLRSSHNPRI
jgi:hypothetical protein